MKIGILASKAHRAILEHTHDAVLGAPSEVDGVMVESVSQEVPEGVPVINTCVAAKVLELRPEHADAFADEFGIGEGVAKSFLYFILSPTRVSDIMEMCVSDRFLSGNIGSTCGLVQATGVPCREDVYQAFPKLAGIIDALHSLNYCGEVSLGVTDGYGICSMTLGHCTGGFAMFIELGMQAPQAMLEFAFGRKTECKLHDDRIACTTLMSYPPYPYTNDIKFSIMAPRQAERHMYRVQSGSCEVAYAAASGCRIFEARRRVKRTLDNCRSYCQELQHRVDYGKFEKFVFSQDRYVEFGGHA